MNLHISWVADYPVDFPLMQTHFWESLIGQEAAFSTNSRINASCDLHSNALKCIKSVSSLVTLIEYICCFRYRKASREGQPKRITGGGESSALIGWHGNTDFFVLLQRERRQRILGHHWHDDRLETHTHTHTCMKQVHDWVILGFKVELTTTLSEGLQRGAILSLSCLPVLLFTSVQICFIAF